jgi:hypothetical protein
MLNEDGINSTSFSVYGSVYSFDTETEREEWQQQHPLVNYLENPQSIPFK